MTTHYTNLYELSDLQYLIFCFISDYIRDKKTPIFHFHIMKEIKKHGHSESAISYSLDALLKYGYIRKAIGAGNKRGTRYVQIRSVSQTR